MEVEFPGEAQLPLSSPSVSESPLDKDELTNDFWAVSNPSGHLLYIY